MARRQPWIEGMERRYQNQAYMVDGMYVIGVKAKSLGEGIIPVVYTREYTTAWLYWNAHPGENLGIFQWFQGGFKNVGRKIIDKKGRPHWVPIPPWNKITA